LASAAAAGVNAERRRTRGRRGRGIQPLNAGHRVGDRPLDAGLELPPVPEAVRPAVRESDPSAVTCVPETPKRTLGERAPVVSEPVACAPLEAIRKTYAVEGARSPRTAVRIVVAAPSAAVHRCRPPAPYEMLPQPGTLVRHDTVAEEADAVACTPVIDGAARRPRAAGPRRAR
jgi:hypothetical protein